MTEALRHPTHRGEKSALFVTAVVLLAASCGLAVWWLLIRASTNSSGPSPTTPTASPVAVSQSGLETLASLGRPIYWAGPRPHDTYELTQAAGGKIYVRYLPVGVKVGSPNVYLTIATYPMTNAYSVTKQVADRAGSVAVPATGGGVAFSSTRLPTNVYVAYPGSDYQVEVFDPSPADARRLVSTGAVARVAAHAPGASVPKAVAVAVSPSGLEKLAARLGRPLYWAGPKAKMTYELTQTPDGRIYIRYLPAGVAVGASHPYLTVGTYPVPNAYATTAKAAKAAGAIRLNVPGGVAFYDSARPTSVYVAFPKSDEQIEVYDPTASIARSVVSGHEITAVS